MGSSLIRWDTEPADCQVRLYGLAATRCGFIGVVVAIERPGSCSFPRPSLLPDVTTLLRLQQLVSMPHLHL